jgi:predicted alpha/beta-fold hydrolase
VAAICSPLFLAESSKHFDVRVAPVYRRHVLSGLQRAYLAFHNKRPLPGLPSLKETQAIRWICDWDERVVAPRHGFADAAAYYAAASVGPHLGDVSVPSLLIAADCDPMVDPVAQQRWVARNANSWLEFRVVRGGHLGFASCDLGETAALNLDAQVLSWLLRHTCSDA